MNHGTYAIIPIRMGSKGIPNKNIRLVGDKTLLQIAIEKCMLSGVFDEIFVSSENEAIRDYALSLGVKTHVRSPNASNDSSTLEDVALEFLRDSGITSGSVAVVQATSPSFPALELFEVVQKHKAGGAKTTILVKPVRHLHWRMANGKTEPLFAKRVNRQFMIPELFSETGAVLVRDIESLLSTGMLVDSTPDLVVANQDFEDIDTMWDLYQTRNSMQKLTVVFRITANQNVGSGHLYHALLVADELPEFRRVFVTHNCSDFVTSLLESRGYEVFDQGDMELVSLLERHFDDLRNCLLINDTLDTTESFWLDLESTGLRKIAVEDLGFGPKFADVTINALYSSNQSPNSVVLTGPKWNPIRKEFELAKLAYSKTTFGICRVTVTFGGVDPENLTQRVCNILEKHSGIALTKVITGLGYTKVLDTSLKVVNNPQSFSSELMDSDIVITSGGRTVFEAGYLGKPTIVVAQNTRETTHSHLDSEFGVMYLGLGSEITDEHLESQILSLVLDIEKARALGERASRSVDGRGAERIAWLAKSLLEGAPVRELIEARSYKSDQDRG